MMGRDPAQRRHVAHTAIWHSFLSDLDGRATMIGSLINCIIISKHSDFLPAVKAPERGERSNVGWSHSTQTLLGEINRHIVTVPPTGRHRAHTKSALPLAVTNQTQRGWAFVRAAMGHLENSIPFRIWNRFSAKCLAVHAVLMHTQFQGLHLIENSFTWYWDVDVYYSDLKYSSSHVEHFFGAAREALRNSVRIHPQLKHNGSEVYNASIDIIQVFTCSPQEWVPIIYLIFFCHSISRLFQQNTTH